MATYRTFALPGGIEMNRGISLVIAASVTCALTAGPALARKADTLRDLNGSRAAGAESALRDRGFDYTAGHKGSMGSSYSYWWHNADKNCVAVEVMGGNVMTINDAPRSDCGHSGSGNAAAAAGAVAGLALLGALLNHKSSHHDDGRHLDDQQSEAQYERGYNDGLYNAAYHNYDRQDAYSRGYEAGVNQRNANLQNHHNRGGYSQVADYSDLRGARAAGAMDDLGARGFRQVDNFTSGDTRYSIMWRSQSRQCLQVTIADGSIYDITDIQSHPRCR